MESLFLNSGFLAVAGALVSVPIIIHLINRMRFKRIRWAAMEFLLKAQKRKRKRLIIEQLLLLMLRCLLIALIGLLVARFISPAFAAFGSKPALNVVLLDDTLSMQQEWDDDDKEKGKKSAFQVALGEVAKIGDEMKKSGAADELVILPLSRFVNDPDFTLTYHKYLNDEGKQKELQDEIKKIEPSMQHVPLSAAMGKITSLLEAREGNQVFLHIVGDVREKDWDQSFNSVQKDFAALTLKHKDFYGKIADVLDPIRTKENVPESPDNVAIVDLKPATRVVSKTMRMEFVMKLANFSSQDQDVNIQVFDEITGEERLDVNFRVPLPVKIPAKRDDITVTFDLPPMEVRKELPYKAGHLFISAKLTDPNNKYNPLAGDGLPADNKRYTSVEVRDGVPVLLIDGRGKSTKDPVSQDWFYLDVGLTSAPSASYEVQFGEDLGGGVPARALERSDILAKFSAVYLLNVTDLNARQIANLEAYVAAGGGVAFFMGPEVSKDFYNRNLYKGGKGLFPVELTEVVSANLDGLDIRAEDKQSQDLILRERLFTDLDSYPIFGKMLRDGMNRRNFENINISKYYRVKRPERADVDKDKLAKEERLRDLEAQWKTVLDEKGKAELRKTIDDLLMDKTIRTTKIQELATLPSERVIQADVTAKIGAVFFPDAGKENDPWNKVLADPKFAKYHDRLKAYRDHVRSIMTANLGKKVYHLARPLNELLSDPGAKIEKDGKLIPDPKAPGLSELWANSDIDAQRLRDRILNLYEEFAYGDPFVLSSNFGAGRVVVCLTTAGKRWSGWSGGSSDEPSAFPIFLEELQKYLASQGSQSAYTVGASATLPLDAEVFKQRNIPLFQVKRSFLRPVDGKAAELLFKEDVAGKEKNGVVDFALNGTAYPGLSVTELIDPAGEVVTSVAHVFNVDALSEGPLQRTTSLETVYTESRPNSFTLVTPKSGTGDRVPQQSVFSETPFFFFLIICVLIAEQALAVHLSFHLKGNDLPMPTAGRVAPAAA